MYTILLIVIYIAFIGLGLPDSLTGSGWPVMYLELNVPLSSLGLLTMTIAGGTIVSSLLSDRLNRILSTKWVVIISTALTALAMFGFSISTKFFMLILWAIPYGLGAGSIDAALNNYVALHYTSRHMNWLHSFWGVGTIISPYVMSYSLTNYNWNMGYRIVSYIQIGIVLILLLSIPLWKKRQTVKEEVKPKVLGPINALKIKGVVFLLFAFFAYCSFEAMCMGWISTYLVKVRAIDEKTAAAFASLFFIGITVGRFISGFISGKLGDRRMIRIGIIIILLGLLLVAISIITPVLSLIGFVIVGLGCAPIYPSIIHSTPDNFGKENSQSIVGIEMASAYVGSTFMPPLFGLIASSTTFEIMPYYILIFVGLLILMMSLMYKKTRNKEEDKGC